MDGTQSTNPTRRALADEGKGARLEGGALDEEALDSSRSILRRRGVRSGAGLQQFFSPPEAADLAHQVLTAGPGQPAVLDPTAGNGALLERWPRALRFGVELDRDQVAAGDYRPITGDIQRLYPLLRASGARWPAVVCNPPFGLDWKDSKGKTTNSTSQCLAIAVGLLHHHGQGMLIAGRDRYHREVATTAAAAGVWATIDCDDLFPAVDGACTLAFFAHPDRRNPSEPTRHHEATRAELGDLAATICAERQRGCTDVGGGWTLGISTEELATAFDLAKAEHDRRRATSNARRQRYDLQLKGTRLACHPSAYAKVALNQRRVLRQIEQLNGKALSYFALNPREWAAVAEAADAQAMTIEPTLADRVATMRAKAAINTVPLYPVKPQMRLGFLADASTIHCVKDDPDRGYVCGQTYPVHSRTKVTTEEGERLVDSRTGEQQLRRYQRERKLLELRIGRHSFDEGPDSIGYVLEHFDVPDPGDLGSRFRPQVDAATADLEALADEHGFRFKPFQLEDLARLIVKGSGLLGWEQGLGKSLGQLALAETCVRRGAQEAVLLVVPQDLVPQWQREARKFFGRTLELIDGPASARAAARRLKAGGTGWFITYYEALSITGRREEHRPEQVLEWSAPDPVTGERVPTLTSADVCPSCREDTGAGWNGTVCNGCGYVHKRLAVRNAASHLAGAFRRGVICVDELSLIRGDESLRSKAIRALRAEHRFGGTGTPISNYVNDAFWGLWWVLGNASERFPYDYEGGKAKFESDFCVIEHVMGNKKGEEHLRKRRKVLPEVTNLSLLWRLLAGGMIRRRKEDTGEPLVRRVFRPVEVPFGVAQQDLHRAWLARFTKWFIQTHPDSPLTKAGVVEQFAAGLGQLPKLEYAATLPAGDPDLGWTGVQASNWTPKTLKALELCLERVRAGDKVLVGSCIVETGRFLAERLVERGVNAVHIVEESNGRAKTKNPRKRAAELAAFVEGDAQVLCAGVNAIKLGHNLDTASTVILDGLPWSHEGLDQFLARVHRLTSKREVNVFILLTRGSLDVRKWDLLTRKGQAADLALDGQLVEEPEEPTDWAKVLKEMRRAGVATTGDEVDEAELEALWLRAEGAYRPLEHEGAVQPGRPALRLVTTGSDKGDQPAPEEADGQLQLGLAA